MAVTRWSVEPITINDLNTLLYVSTIFDAIMHSVFTKMTENFKQAYKIHQHQNPNNNHTKKKK